MDPDYKYESDKDQRLVEDLSDKISTIDGIPTPETDALLLTWGNLQEAANWCGAADLYDTRYLLLVPTPSGEQMARVGDTIIRHKNGSFSVRNSQLN